jgi:hypothetical protein
VGYNSDSTHTHRVYILGKNLIAVEQNIQFTPANVTIHTAPNPTTLSPAPPAGMQPPPPPPPPSLPPAMPPTPAMARPGPSNILLPDSDEEDGDKEELGEEDPVLPGQYQSPAVSKNTKTWPKTSKPSYTQLTCTSTCKRQPADIDRQIAAGKGTADGRMAERKGKKKTGAVAELIDKLAYLSVDCAFITKLTPVVAEVISNT